MLEILEHLADAPVANLIVLAGLGLLGVAAIGKVTATINPTARDRVISGILGTGLVVGGLIGHAGSEGHRIGPPAPRDTIRPERTAVEGAAVSTMTANTSWNVAAYDDHGVLGGYSGTPYWEFHPDGRVNAGTVWSGRWVEVDKDTIDVRLMNGDEFILNFTSPRTFSASKSGRPYRLGRRIS
jgi:hypothetical protein